jgi:predicted phage terminase large subunit-like protein
MEEVPHKELCDVLMALVQPLFPDVEFEITTKWVIELKNNPEELKRKALIMLPRVSFKSTVVSNGFVIWLMWHNPDIRIMIDTETLTNSKFYLAGIKDMIDNNELLKAICVDDDGNYLLAPNKDIPGGCNEDSVILKSRKKLGLKEPTIFCSGVDNARTGMHMEVLICDDLVSERNVKTPDQILKTKDHYRFSLSLLEPNGVLIVIGTRYHLNDLYSELINAPGFFTLVRPAILDDGSLYFPSRLTKEFLDQQRRDQGSYIYASQYMLNPVSDDTAIFKEIDLIRYTKGKHPEFSKKVITCDLAISDKETSDDRVVAAFGITPRQEVYALEYVNGVFSPYKQIDYIFQLAEKYDIVDVGIEVVAYQKAFIYMLEAEMRRRGKFLRITELKAKGSKIERAMGFQPYVEQHKFYCLDEHKALIEEMSQFPFAKHDDIVDAVTYVPQMLNPYRSGKSKLKRVYKPSDPVMGY